MDRIDSVDWRRVKHLLKLGIAGALMTVVGDMLLGWGVHDAARSGMEGYLSAYLGLSDARLLWSALLGFIGIPLEALSSFAVYRMIEPFSGRYAHMYRAGILGELAFAGCGVHVPCLACVFFYKYMSAASPETALSASIRFGLCFLLPGMAVFLIFWIVKHVAQISAFAKGLTPLPRRCWLFCPAVGMALVMLLKLLPETALRNALTAGWMSFGGLWCFGGLLAASRKRQ